MEYGLVALWLATYLLVGAAALPLTAALFPRFPDRGATFAIPMGLATIAVVGYLVGQIAFGAPALVAGLLVLAVSSYLLGDLRAIEPRDYAESMAVFAVGFLLIVAVRASNPEIAPLPLSAGEKFLDFGLLRSLLRADALPPADMWFAGETVQYYYGGHLLAALLTRLTRTDPAFAYNLALAGFYGAVVVAAYGLAGSIAAAHEAPRRLSAALGAFFVGLAGNLHTAGRVLGWLLPDSLVTAITPLSPDDSRLAWTPSEFWYWDASRIIDGTINEFPLFAWLNGDLHAHMMSTPFTLLIAACCFAYWQTPETERRRRLALLGATTPLVGLVALTNTWSFPTAGGLVLLAIAFAPADPATLLPTRFRTALGSQTGAIEEIRRDSLGVAVAFGVLLIGGLWVLPFWLDSASTRSVSLFPERSPLAGLLVVHGGFLLVFAPYLAGRVGRELREPVRISAASVGTLAAAAGAWYAGFAAVALFGPLLIGAWALLRTRTDVGFETVLMLAGFGLVILVEFVHVVDPGAPERLNTVFKVYFQTWVLWAPAAGVALTRLTEPAGTLDVLDSAGWRAVGVSLLCVVVLATGLYAGLAVPEFLSNEPADTGGSTLDGTAYLETFYSEESEAIAWLDDRDEQPTIVTAAPGGYTWDPEAGEGASAPASLTGLPTVLGWHHQEQYRSSERYGKRLADVTEMYEGDPETQRQLFEYYDVTYVYVGPAERTRYDLTVESHPDLEVVFESDDVLIYER